MYIRRKVFSVGIDEYGEERLFSVNEVISEESYQRLFAEAEAEKGADQEEAKEEYKDKDKKTKEKIKSGKLLVGAGTGLGLAGSATAIGEAISANMAEHGLKDKLHKVAKKTGTVFFPDIRLDGGPVTSGIFHGYGKNAQANVNKARELAERYGKKLDRELGKKGKKGLAGLGVGVAGLGLQAYGRHKLRKAIKEKQQYENENN